jgi:hypothetical protein
MALSTVAREFVNRLIICTFAICLLWLTSLQVAVEIVNVFFMAPGFHEVYRVCESTATAINSHRTSYHSCVSDQLHLCSSTYSSVYSQENKYMAKTQARNTKYMSEVNSAVVNSTAALENVKAALKSWGEQDVLNVIPYISSGCPESALIRAKAFTDDTTVSSQSSFYRSFNDYVVHENVILNSLTSYGEALAEYNMMYIANKTGRLHFLSTDFISEVALPHIHGVNASIAEIEASISTLIDCIGLTNLSYSLNGASNGTCPLTRTVRSVYHQLQVSAADQVMVMEGTLRQWQNTFTSFQKQVTTALKNADSFYDSINGAAGLVQNVQKLLASAQISVNLCSSGTWCYFNKVWFCLLPCETCIDDLPDWDL